MSVVGVVGMNVAFTIHTFQYDGSWLGGPRWGEERGQNNYYALTLKHLNHYSAEKKEPGY